METATVKFTDFEYQRPDIAQLKSDFNSALERFKEASDVVAARAVISEIYEIRNGFETMKEIAGIRYTIDTRDEKYEQEQDFFDREQPQYEGLVHSFYKALLASPLESDLRVSLGDQLFDVAKCAVNTFSDEIVEDLQKENELTTAYRKLKASASVEFNGEEYTLTGLMAFLRRSDRDQRKKAADAIWSFMAQNRQELDRIYHELVQLRTSIARKLGYENYVQLGYDRLIRTDYNSEDVAGFRKQVLEGIVPVATRIRKAQEKRIGVDKLYFYDEELNFLTGNPEPKGDADWILDQGRKMYEDLSDSTGEFINFMMDADLMDVVTKKGKAPGGYCTFIHGHKAPFIFSNFNGTAMDIFVLTHEAGHAFQVYKSRDYPVSEYNWPTLEACEIHSMSMEFFTWPWMEQFFGDEADKFRYMHLVKSLIFLPYGVAVDEFQHHVYENPDETPEQRAAAWSAIEKKYLPHRDFDGNEYLESGRFWQMQGHIFESPFYYIDYTLAQICAFQFWKKAESDRDQAFKDYVKLCEAGGSMAFLKLVDYAGLESPFQPSTVSSLLDDITGWLDANESKMSEA